MKIKAIILITILSLILSACTKTQPKVQENKPETTVISEDTSYEDEVLTAFTMKDVVKFLTEHKQGFLATTEDGKPRVSPFEFGVEDGGKLYFCTANSKEVYNQIKANPYIEFSSSAPGNTWIRVSGEVKFSDNIKIKEKIINSSELVKSIYKTPDNPLLEIFYLINGTATKSSLSGAPTKKLEF